MKTGVIVNPAAGSGRMQVHLPELGRALRERFPDLTVCKTSGPSDAGRLAHKMAGDRAELVIAVGGDGTIGEVADGLMRHHGERPAIGVISCGTGSDFARIIGQSGDLRAQVARPIPTAERQVSAISSM
jgi:diacylglycerol kinase (ATP)